MQKTLCAECIHYVGDSSCKAFPEGIPEEIMAGDNDHKTPLPGQENDLIYVPKYPDDEEK